MHFLTLTVIEWIDIFTKPQYFKILTDSLKYCIDNKGLLVYEFVFLTNHIHLIISAKEGFDLAKIIQDFKRHTTKEIIKQLKQDKRKHILVLLRGGIYDPSNQGMVRGLSPEPTYKNKVGSDLNIRTRPKKYQDFILDDYKGSIWQNTNYPEVIESEKFLDQKIDYTHNNPVLKEYVLRPEDWYYSSAGYRLQGYKSPVPLVDY